MQTNNHDINKKNLAVERGKRIKLARQIAGLTRKDMAAKYDINDNTIQSWEKGVNLLTEQKAQKLVTAFVEAGLSITTEWLLSGHDPILFGELFSTAEISTNKNQEFKDVIKIDKDFKILDEIKYFRSTNDNAIVATVTDDSLMPFFKIGDYIGGTYTPEEQLQSLVGHFCIIILENGSTLVKKIFKYCDNNQFIIGSVNPLTTIQEPINVYCNIKAAAKITRHWSLENK